MKSFGWVFVFCLLVSTASAQKVSDPVLQSAELPKYPVVALSAHISGQVEAQFTVDQNGSVSTVQVLSGPPLLTRATEENIHTWKFHITGQVAGTKYRTAFTYHFSGRQVRSGVPRLTVTFDSFHRIDVTSDVYEVQTEY